MAEALEIPPYTVVALTDKDLGADAHEAALETICGILPFAHPKDVVIAVDKEDSFATRLLALVSATRADQGDMPLLAAQAIAQFIKMLPQWANNFIDHGAIQALRDRLIAAIDNVELAEEYLRALNFICMELPGECLRLGVAAAVLQSFELFSASMQKVALNIVANLVEDCDEADMPKAMEAAPALCSLLLSSDKTIHKSAHSFLGMLASGARRKAQHKDRTSEHQHIIELCIAWMLGSL